MGHIKEPPGVDFVIGPSIHTEEDRQLISQAIAEYKRTGKLPDKSSKTATRARAVQPNTRSATKQKVKR